ncbi:MAG: FKBP-type peptidyl-prolyl cis-trans isomerase [Cryobacterium sp.]
MTTLSPPTRAWKMPTVVAVAALSLALAGCSSADPADTPDAGSAATSATAECTAPGEVSDSVSVTGDFGVAPTVTFDTPLESTQTERSVAIEGDGAWAAETGSLVEVTFTAFSATSGEQIDTSGYGDAATPAPLTVDEAEYITGLVRALNCSVEGDRVVVVIPPADGFGEAGSTDYDITAEDSMVFVIDVNTVVPPRATGVAQPTTEGLPSVELADDGAPSISIPDADAPNELQIATLKQGDGAIVAAGDTVAVEYTGVIWDSGEEFDSHWAVPGPASFTTDAVVSGFGAALVGQAEGSQVIAVIPAADGYGAAGNDQAGISGTDTLVFVIDILATTPASAPQQ